MINTAGYSLYTDDYPSVAEIERWVAGYLNAAQLAEIITRSFDYIRKLPLQGIHEHYFDDGVLLSEGSDI